MAGKGFCDRADAEERAAVRLAVRSLIAAAKTLDRGLAVADDADDERGDLRRQEQDLPGETDRLVELRRPGAGRPRPRRRGCGEEYEDVATAHGFGSSWGW